MAGALVVILLGIALVAAGTLWKGRVRKPYLRVRARDARAGRLPRDLRRSADMAIAVARTTAAPDEPAIIRVDDVITLAADHFGHADVVRAEAAAALRERYERNRCEADCVTDAYERPPDAGAGAAAQ